MGFDAGLNLRTGSNNIEIGNPGTINESDTLRIGINGTQKRTFIAGISGTTISGADVVVSSTGQLGIATSSARYKYDIRGIGGASAGLMRLRPVSFRYKSDPSRTLQYGLVAEEVARMYPELVTRDTDGKLQSVRYLEFTALLLNELQKQTKQLQTQASRTRELAQRLETKDGQLAALQREIDALKQQKPASMVSAPGSRRLSSKRGRRIRSQLARSRASRHPANKHNVPGPSPQLRGREARI